MQFELEATVLNGKVVTNAKELLANIDNGLKHYDYVVTENTYEQAKKDRGEWDDYGRHRIMSPEEFAKEYKKVEQGKIGSLELMRQLKMKKSTYFKYVNEYKERICL